MADTKKVKSPKDFASACVQCAILDALLTIFRFLIVDFLMGGVSAVSLTSSSSLNIPLTGLL